MIYVSKGKPFPKHFEMWLIRTSVIIHTSENAEPIGCRSNNINFIILILLSPQPREKFSKHNYFFLQVSVLSDFSFYFPLVCPGPSACYTGK